MTTFKGEFESWEKAYYPSNCSSTGYRHVNVCVSFTVFTNDKHTIFSPTTFTLSNVSQ